MLHHQGATRDCHLPPAQRLVCLPGEGQKQNVDDMLAAALQYYGEAGLLDSTPVSLALEREKPIQALSSPLRYPGKLAADLAGNRLFISDSNNHRCLATTRSSVPHAFLPPTISWPTALLINVSAHHLGAVVKCCSAHSSLAARKPPIAGELLTSTVRQERGFV